MYPNQVQAAARDEVRKAGVISITLGSTDGELNGIHSAYERLEAAYQRLCNPAPRPVAEDRTGAAQPISPTVEAQLGQLNKKASDLSVRLHNLAERFEAALS